MSEGIIYNVTTAVSPAIESAWLDWMLNIHIPEVLGTGCFYKHQLVKILDTDDADGATYAVQYYAANKALYEDFIKRYAPAFRKVITGKWGDEALSFRTLMAIVQ